MSARPATRVTSRSLCVAMLLGTAAGALAQPGTPLEVIEVVGTTPLGADLDTDRIATNVQGANAAAIREQGALDLADFMNRTLGSVFVNEVQSNPLQPDVQYRGFVGSPLLGLPQGLAIYQDGVRLNEPFGDTVNWALIPESAIDSVYLVPGSNPLFGLNALGGAIAIRTKDGINHAGTRAEVVTGSFDRLGLQAETGGAFGEGLAYFVTATRLTEDGWRDFSPTEAEQLFAKLTSTGEQSRYDVTFTHADTELIGNGPAARRSARARSRGDLHPPRHHREPPEHVERQCGTVGFRHDHAARQPLCTLERHRNAERRRLRFRGVRGHTGLHLRGGRRRGRDRARRE